MKQNHVWLLSAVLIVLNILVGSVVIFNLFSNNQQVELAKANFDSQVLGESTNVPTFSPNYVMSDETFRSSRVFPTQNSVQSYLDSVNSPLSNYTDQGQTASYWIFNAARGVTSSKYGITPNINPGVIMAYLEKEQSLLSYRDYDTYNDPENRIRTATGYGCPDQSVCDSVYFGFANQVNWTAYQLELNFQQSITTGGGSQYLVNNTITTLDEYSVFLSNQATAAQYRYTPHVYWGNYNLWKILTAYGWGVDPNTYSLNAIDDVNLAGLNGNIGEQTNYGITRDQVDPILRTQYDFGTQNSSIELLQKFLKQEGYYATREINGMYGTVTKQAHEAYLLDYQIAYDVNNPAPVSSSTTCNTLISRDWNIYVDYGEEGKQLQQCLRDLGVFNWPSNTGYVGDVTTAALVEGRVAIGVTNSSQVAADCESFKTAGIPFGETSQRVVQLQGCMRSAGVFNWPNGDTGYYGPVTQASFEQWIGSGTVSSNASCEDLKSQTFVFGETGDRVIQLQACMRADGVFNWPFGDTGFYGPVSVEAFGLWTGAGSTQTFTCDELKEQVWTKGETSNRVVQLQGCMRSAGVFNWPNGDTGYFGDATEASIIAWRGFL